ncbi:TPA: hypothetical protein N0F65_000505 [Lagenidium giganteum]|uniref:CCHC-type domain-containing protein n=1 Tax=Lagenidium giganteum TaxID=4803 RepID=A0AAV2YYW4_9STRA|nr:TPA: hypothetical protein N0F65_000505 [Lagenidium giganteum]
MARTRADVTASRTVVPALDDMSDVSVNSVSDTDEELHVMDPSDPRAHGRTADAMPKPRDADAAETQMTTTATPNAVVDATDDGAASEGENTESADDTATDETGDEQPKPLAAAKLSSWAKSRFLVSRKDRVVPEMVELPIEPLNDFILSDFGSRYRGKAGDVDVKKQLTEDDMSSSEDEAEPVLQVGAPLFSTDDVELTAKKGKKARRVEATPRGVHVRLGSDDEADNDEPAAAAAAETSTKEADANAATAFRWRKENRYFVTDLATKCFNCGQVGHMSSLCMNDKVLKPCYYCGLRGHMAFSCPHMPCYQCLQVGHDSRDCTSKKVRRQHCGICGRGNHDDAHCDDADASFRDVTCMVCLKAGHLHCVPIPPPADRRVYCANCGRNHTISECPDYVDPGNAIGGRQFRSSQKCFVCYTTGHIAAECPSRNGYMNNSCFRCGEYGHFSNDCTGGKGRNGRMSGRKRGRDMDDDDSYEVVPSRSSRTVRYVDASDSEDEQQYYVPGRSYQGGRRSGAQASKPRLDAALPSYRSQNGRRQQGGGGNYNNNRRR